MRPYRSNYYNDERKWKSTHLLDDVLQVGKHKALGYVSSSLKRTYRENCKHHDLFMLELELRYQGKFTFIGADIEEDSEYLWVGDPEMLSLILNKNKELIVQHNWPTTPKEFFDKICMEHIDHESSPEMYHVVCELFNSWCLWCETPIWRNGEKEPFSANPYDPDNDK